MAGFIQETLNGLTFAGLLFLLGSGFALTFGLMRIVNLTHGSAFLVGGYVGWSTQQSTGSFWLAAVAGAASMAAFGLLLERALLRRVVNQEMSQFLLTIGVSFIVADFALVTWGGNPLSIQMPGALAKSTHLGSITYPISRLFILAAASVIAILLWIFLAKTRVGAIVRAGVDDREMVSALGINVGLVFTGVFVLGMLLAGLAGVFGGSLLALAPGGDMEILIYVFAIVIIGGRGTLAGAVAGSLVVGLVSTYGEAYFPSFAYFALFAPMVVILLLRPQGLFGKGQVSVSTATGAVRAIVWRSRPLKLLAVVVSLAFFASFPSYTGSFYTSLALTVLVFGLMAMSLDILAGYTGMFSFGHAAYFGLGAYGIAYAEHKLHGPTYAMGFSLLVVLVVACVFGLVAVRVSGLTFGIVTMSLGGIVWGLAYRWVSVTGGDNGLPILFQPTIFGYNLETGNNYYYFVLGVFVLCAILMRTFVSSPFGLTLRGIRDNEARMRTLGYEVTLHKYVAYVVAGFFAGIAGILYGFYNLYVSPTTLDLPHNFVAVMMVVLGGLGTLWGGLAGAAVIVLMQQWLSIYMARWEMVMGGVFVLAVLFARAGILGSLLVCLRTLLVGLRTLARRLGAPTQTTTDTI